VYSFVDVVRLGVLAVGVLAVGVLIIAADWEVVNQ